MGFGNEFLERASKEYRIRSVESDYELVGRLISEAVDMVCAMNGNVKAEDVKVYMHGSYPNKTNTFFPSRLEVAVELGRTSDFDPSDEACVGYKVHNNYFVETTFEFNPSDFSGLLYMALQELTGGACVQSDKFIEIPKGEIEGFGVCKHIVEIMPCFTFKYREKVDVNEAVVFEEGLQIQSKGGEKVSTGVLLYCRHVNSHIVTFPRLHESNGKGKDLATGGNFLHMVRLFKTLNTIGYRESDFLRTRGYFVQCLLFNVPNELFILPNMGDEPDGDDLRVVFYKILNWLTNCEIGQFVCQNLVWGLFGKAEEFWSEEEARVFIRDVKKLHDSFPGGRTELV